MGNGSGAREGHRLFFELLQARLVHFDGFFCLFDFSLQRLDLQEKQSARNHPYRARHPEHAHLLHQILSLLVLLIQQSLLRVGIRLAPRLGHFELPCFFRRRWGWGRLLALNIGVNLSTQAENV